MILGKGAGNFDFPVFAESNCSFTKYSNFLYILVSKRILSTCIVYRSFIIKSFPLPVCTLAKLNVNSL